MPEAKRTDRVGEEFREVLAEEIPKLKDPRVGFVTVTAVDTSPDLRHAKVFVSVLGHAGVRARSMDGLRSAHGYLQRLVASELRLKHTPTLAFIYDDTAERAERVERLLGEDPA